MKIGQYLA